MKPTWLSFHIHYNSDPFWLITETIEPLIARLLEEKLLANYFFIRYWEKGPHIRLRLMPTRAADAPALLQAVRTPVEQFMARRPSIFKFPKYMGPRYRDLYIEEYSEEALYAKYGETGLIPFEKNNSIQLADYEPEYARYGGPLGTDIAQAYFEDSSTIAFQLLSGQNGHDFRIVLGQAFRFFVYVCLIFLEASERAGFAAAYQRQWAQFGGKRSPSTRSEFDYKYARQRDFLDQALQGCEDVIAGRTEPTPIDAAWVAALRRLQGSLAAAEASGDIVVPEERGGLPAYIRYLLPSYIHMHDNRLGLAISDEVYLAFLVSQALENHG